MPKKREKKDPNFDVGPGHTRKAQGYDPAKDKRGIKKELMKIKGKGSLSNKKCHKLWKKSISFLIPPPQDNVNYFAFGKK